MTEQSINIDSFVANTSMDEGQSRIANSVSPNTSPDLKTSLSVNSGRTKKGRKRKHVYSKVELKSKKNSNI